LTLTKSTLPTLSSVRSKPAMLPRLVQGGNTIHPPGEKHFTGC
jgi:hypothetical protein